MKKNYIFYVNRMLLVACLAGFALSGHAFPNPTATSSPAPTPTPTCPPCDYRIISHVFEIDDAQGTCTDADGVFDAGEVATLKILFSQGASSCTSQRRAQISVDNPHMTIMPDFVNLDEQGFSIDLKVIISPEAECNEEATVLIETFAFYCNSTISYSNFHPFNLEIDLEGETWECDDTPCGLPPTPTSQQLGMKLIMPDRDLTGGDRFELTAIISNSTSELMLTDCWILLNAGDRFWFYPSWRSMDAGVDCQPYVTVDAFDAITLPILNFDWPDGVGAASALRFYGLAVVADSFDFIGEMQIVEWGYR